MSKLYTIRWNLLALIFVIWIAMLPAIIQAQTLALAPAEIDHTFRPGQPFNLQLAVSNDGDEPVALRVTVTDLWYNDKYEKTFGVPGSSPRSAANWIEFVPPHATVAAHGTQQIEVMVTPPLDASGGYYAVIFVESKPQLVQSATSTQKGIYANVRLGALVLLSTENTEQYSMDISDLNVAPPTENRNLEVSLIAHNTGNTHIFPRPMLAIMNDRHQLLAKAEGEMSRFLPDQKGRVNFKWLGALPAGSYEGIVTVLYGKDKAYTQSIQITVPPLVLPPDRRTLELRAAESPESRTEADQ